MPNKEGNSNNQENETPADKEPNEGLLKRRPDQALLLTARTPINTGMPSLISYIQQKSRQVGEISSQLARHIIGRDYLNSVVSRATRLPLLSTTFDYISRKTIFVTPLLQKMLELPWFRRHPKQIPGISRTAGAAADGIKRDTISLHTDELHPDTLLQTFSGTEGQSDDETCQPAAEETYPMIISDRPLPPATRMKTPDVTSELLHYPLVTSRRFDIQQGINRMATQRSSESIGSDVEPSQVTPDTASEPPSQPRFTSMPSDAGQIIDRMVPQRRREFIGSPVEPPGIPLSGAYRSREDEKTDRTQFEDTPESLPDIGRQPQSAPQSRKWSQVLMTLARRVFRRQKPKAAHPDIAAEGISEVHDIAIWRPDYAGAVEGGGIIAERPTVPFPADTPITGEPHEAAVPDVQIQREPTGSRQPAIYESKGPSPKSPAPSGPSVFRSILDLPLSIPGPSIVRKAARYISQLVSKQPSPMTSTTDEGSKKVHGRISPEKVPPADQPRAEPAVSPSPEAAVPKDSVVYRTEDITGEKQRPDTESAAFIEDKAVYQAEGRTETGQGMDTLYPLALEYGRIDRDYIQRRIIKPRLHRESPFVTIPPVLRLPVPDSTRRSMAPPSQRLFRSRARRPLSERIEDYGFQRDLEYMPSASGYEYGREPALEMTVPSLIQPKAEFDAAYIQDFLATRYSILPELTYTRSQNLPEPEQTQVSRAIEPFRPMAIEPKGEEGVGKAAAPDIDAVARDVYRLLRRRLINERERTLGVV